jgi:tetratricopeptide (TPR) repeat protein
MKQAFFCFLILLCACNNIPDKKLPSSEVPESMLSENKLRVLITKYPDSLLLKENLVQYFRDSGNFSKAIITVDSFINRDSMNARLWNIKATLHFEDADTLHAIQAFEKAIAILPMPESLVSLGTLYAQTSNPSAILLADQLLKDPKAHAAKDALYIKGLFYSFNNEKLRSIGYFDQCLSLNYTFMDAYREKAIALYDLGKYSDALAVLDKAITLQNNFDEGYFYSGKCLEKLNRIPEAIQSYQNAMVYDPEYIEAKEALKRLSVK